MRGEICVGFASILSFASLLMLIFVHVAQINTSTIPRKIAMVLFLHIPLLPSYQSNHRLKSTQVDTAQGNPRDPYPQSCQGLYATNTSTPLQARAGLRQEYDFGLYSYCAYVNNTGSCSNSTAGQRFTPYEFTTADMFANYSIISASLIPQNAFRDSKYLGDSSKAAYWMILLGTISASLALLTGIAKNSLTFFVSSFFASVGSLLLLIGASIWTVLIKKAQNINSVLLTLPNTDTGVPIGITVSEGAGLYLTWASFVCLFLSIIPYFISCCTYRG